MAAGPEYEDRLLRFIGHSAFAREVLKKIETDGYAVLPDVFSPEEMDREYARMWDWVETVAPGVRRRSSASWRRQEGGFDPWPSKQRDMMQLHQAGWVFTELREQFGHRVFEELYGTRALHCSKDGFTLQRPTSRDLNKAPNDHFDQSSGKFGLQCIQGSVALTDQEHDDGCFLCWPGSHKYHRQITSQRRQGARQDFVILDDSEKEFLQEQGIQPLRVPVKRGTVILFRSDLAHKGALPIGRRDNFRGVVYVCMLPAVLTPPGVYSQKRQAYAELHTSSHWPCVEEWFRPGRGASGASVRPYFRQPPVLTPRQRLLYGLDRYVESELVSTRPLVACCRAMEQNVRMVEEVLGTQQNANESEGRKRRWGKASAATDLVDAASASSPDKTDEAEVVTAEPCVGERPERGAKLSTSNLPSLPSAVAVEKESRKLRKALQEIRVLEQRKTLLQNQKWKVDKKAQYIQRLCEFGVSDVNDDPSKAP